MTPADAEKAGRLISYIGLLACQATRCGDTRGADALLYTLDSLLIPSERQILARLAAVSDAAAQSGDVAGEDTCQMVIDEVVYGNELEILEAMVGDKVELFVLTVDRRYKPSVKRREEPA